MLHVKTSQIPGAGKGLFTDEPIKKGERIAEYAGEIISYNDDREHKKKLNHSYVLNIDEKYCIDAYHYTDTFGRYANDAKGLNRVEGLFNNSKYEIAGQRGYIVAIIDIPAGSEIFVGYGDLYWGIVKQDT